MDNVLVIDMDNVLVIDMDWKSFKKSLIRKDLYIAEEGNIGTFLKTPIIRNVLKNISRFWKCECKSLESIYVKGLDKGFNIKIIFEEPSDVLLFKLKYNV